MVRGHLAVAALIQACSSWQSCTFGKPGSSPSGRPRRCDCAWAHAPQDLWVDQRSLAPVECALTILVLATASSKSSLKFDCCGGLPVPVFLKSRSSASRPSSRATLPAAAQDVMISLLESQPHPVYNSSQCGGCKHQEVGQYHEVQQLGHGRLLHQACCA